MHPYSPIHVFDMFAHGAIADVEVYGDFFIGKAGVREEPSDFRLPRGEPGWDWRRFVRHTYTFAQLHAGNAGVEK